MKVNQRNPAMNLSRMPTNEIFEAARAWFRLAETLYNYDQTSTPDKDANRTIDQQIKAILYPLSVVSDCLAHLQARLHGED